MPQVFYATCPACGGRFPVHTELWESEYDLLCPFCTCRFPQAESPLIISPDGERRARATPPREPSPDATAESM
jgi:hypothetical protein